MIIGESPSHTRPKGQEDVAFSGKTSRFLWDALKIANITRKDCIVTNLVEEKLPKGKKPTQQMIAENQQRLIDLAKKEDPVIIVPVGKLATEALLGRKVNMLEIAGDFKKSKVLDRWMVPIVHPGAVGRNPKLKFDMERCALRTRVAADTVAKYESERHAIET